MDRNTIFSLDLTRKNNAAGSAYRPCIRKFCDTVYVNCNDISQTIESLKSMGQRCNVCVVIDFREKYLMDGESKTPFTTYAILYDFADSFLLRGWADYQEDLDPFIYQRLYNDEYKPVYLDVDSRLLYEEMDELMSYSLLSNIDGLVISNPRLLKYAVAGNNGILNIVAGNVRSLEQLQNVMDIGASGVIYPAQKCILFEIFHIIRLDWLWRKSQDNSLRK